MVGRGPGELGARRQLVVSQRLGQRRRELGLTQREVTTRVTGFDVRLTDKSLSSLEHGSGLDLDKLPALALALECTVTWLLGLTDDPNRWEPDRPYPPLRSVPPRDELAAAPAGPDDTDHRPTGGAHRPWILGPLEGHRLPDAQP